MLARRRVAIGVAAGGVVVGLGALLLVDASDDDPKVAPATVAEQLADELRRQDYTPEDARCIGDHVATDLDGSDLADLGFDGARLPDSLPPAVVEALGEGILACEATAPIPGIDRDRRGEEPAGDLVPPAASGDAALLSGIYQQHLGLTATQADCLAAATVEASDDGSGPDAGDASFLDAITACDLPDEAVEQLVGDAADQPVSSP